MKPRHPGVTTVLKYDPSELIASNLEVAMGNEILEAWKVRKNDELIYLADLWTEEYLKKVCCVLINLPIFENYDVRGFTYPKSGICGIEISRLKPKPKPKPKKRGFAPKKNSTTSKRVGGES